MITDIRKSRNLMRVVNEQIHAINAGFGVPDSTFLVLCECERPECFERLEIPVDVYEELRSKAHRYVVIAGHEDSGDRRVVPRDGYCIVRIAAPDLELVEDGRSIADRAGLTGPTPLPAA